ncbi:MAG: hypothetical protein ACK52I_36465 [Pseudomonadota bacterium]
MKKTSIGLRNQAKKLIDEAKKIEEIQAMKLGKFVFSLYYKGKISDQAIIKKIKNILGETEEISQINDKYSEK